MAGTGFIPFHCISQNAAFIVRVERQLFHPGVSLFINAHIVLGAKFYRCLDLAAYNGPQMGLTQADNPMLDSMCLVVIHVLLLLIQLLNGLVQLPILVRKGSS